MFGYPLSDKIIFYDNWHNVYGSQECGFGPAVMRHMSMSHSMFQHLRRIRLVSCSSFLTTERPDSLAIARSQACGRVATLAQSILFIAEHCPLLKSSHLYPRRVKYRVGDQKPRKFGSIASALKCLVDHVPGLEVVGICVEVRLVLISTSGDFISSTRIVEKEDYDLELAKVPTYVREDAVQTWCDTSALEALGYGRIVESVSQDDIELLNVIFAGWEDKASSSDLMRT
jgi:hypothetical protein